MLVYRRGSNFSDNLTPRPGIDTDGLSTFDSLERAVEPGGKAQVIDADKLRTLGRNGHVVFAPGREEMVARLQVSISGSAS